MQNITEIDQLLEELYMCTEVSDFVSVANQIDIDPDAFTKYQHFSNAHYTRNCIERTDEFELVLLCWEEGQTTPIHCHGGEECWVYIVDGTMREDRFDYDEYDQLVKTDVLEESAGDVSFMNDDLGFHTLTNTAEGRSMSLHLYAHPIKKCRVYNKSKRDFEYKRMCDYSFKGELVTQEV